MNNASILRQSFLGDRQQNVKTQNHFSDWQTLNHGVPQGTVLGPLVFILHVNGFKNQKSRKMNLVQLVDDTSSLCGRNSKVDL